MGCWLQAIATGDIVVTIVNNATTDKIASLEVLSAKPFLKFEIRLRRLLTIWANSQDNNRRFSHILCHYLL